jgi:hypothetical protein
MHLKRWKGLIKKRQKFNLTSKKQTKDILKAKRIMQKKKEELDFLWDRINKIFITYYTYIYNENT